MEQAFWNAFWLFLGIVAGALVQHALNALVKHSQRKNAIAVLKTEITINLQALEDFKKRISGLRELISAQQIDEQDLFVSTAEFDYSLVSPLVNSGHFHAELGPEFVKAYFSFMRFFNNENAKLLNSMLRTEHEKGSSLKYLDWLFKRSSELGNALQSLRDEKLKN
ncbi:hypothetical protein BMI86_03795 [Thioclava sp. DLFJ5-1]|uniref:hypothetical protein n=1 Tax=Thioclava sp. DLFJ5-1 TaxID=1915314 RepID=UPI000996E44F|nr:hypothetical protein [Thioclava sp. DLFJ5-1]OOY21690.1 hypothetical protein BMI86_03795 [Thioclava sp. DLFJ5-1]